MKRALKTRKVLKKNLERSEQIENTPWFIISDPSAERPYFYNAKKADTFWKLPDEIKKKYKAEILDIYNKLSRNKGKEVVSPENVIKEDESLGEERHPKEANSEANGELPLKKSRQIGSYEWWEIDDPNSKYLYFFNALKSKTYWDVPLEVYRMYQSMELSHVLIQNLL
ncbi:hypothetical protein MHBO_001377 [Bonamia ostreae]|uniref:WW domain-containing protein n=1 Tax=Bonamia ostreae TaxID=126728 RepID=A0ABV2AJM3_9EUKA